MVIFERPIKFEEVDAANIVFFARFVTYAHEAMEHFFGALEGGYASLILERRVGLPAVHVDMSFSAPVRYGDTLRIETSIPQVGNRSATLRYRMIRARDGVLSAELRHKVVTTDLNALKSCVMPADVRALLLAHLESNPEPSP
ncbi:MAG: acyl-CoA thioesterase [Polyangiaceae bacterium]|nr:acyl-CoA thioesterase [Polyangiaceae bacterium]